MTNIATFQAIEAPAPFQGQAVSDFIANMRDVVGKYEVVSDALALSVSATLSTTDTDVKTSAGKVYAVEVVSPSAATAGVTVQVFNTNTPSLGTTVPLDLTFCPAGETVVLNLLSGGSANRYTTAISVACTQAASFTAAPASANQPTVTVLYK